MKSAHYTLRILSLLVFISLTSCRSGASAGVRVLGEVRETGEPVFVLPGDDRMLLVFTHVSGSSENALVSVVYGGLELREVTNREIGEEASDRVMRAWYMEESRLERVDSSDLEFEYERDSPSNEGTLQSAAILLAGVDQQTPFCLVSDARQSALAHCGKGAVLLLAEGQGGEQSPVIPGYTRVNDPGLSTSGSRVGLFARFLKGEETNAAGPAGREGGDHREIVLLGVSPVPSAE